MLLLCKPVVYLADQFKQLSGILFYRRAAAQLLQFFVFHRTAFPSPLSATRCLHASTFAFIRGKSLGATTPFGLRLLHAASVAVMLSKAYWKPIYQLISQLDF